MVLLASGCMAELSEPGPGEETKDPDLRVVPGQRPESAPLKVGEVVNVDLAAEVGAGAIEDVVVELPGATFVKARLGELTLEPGDELQVVDAVGRVVETVYGSATDRWVTRVAGQVAILRLVTGDAPGTRRLVVDAASRGEVDLDGPRPERAPRSICGGDDKLPARCFTGGMYAASQAVGHMIFNKNGGTYFCSGALISANNHFLTNNHCVASQAEVDTVEIRFNYESTNCAGSGLSNVTVLHGGTFLKTSLALDYTLMQLDDNVASVFGWLDVSPIDVPLGAEIYIPQHAGGRRKEVASEDSQTGGPCRVQSVNRNISGFTWGANLGYTCDTEQGSSGSPVLLAGTNKMIALHHLGGCNNIATYMRNIYPEVQAFLAQPPPPPVEPVSTEAPVEGWFESGARELPVPIPDADTTGVSSQLEVPENLMVQKVEVELDIRHSFRGDLVVTLSTPMGHRIVLSDRMGGAQDDLVGTFDITDKLPGSPFTAGPWTLNVRDESKNDSGTLRHFGLRINDEPLAIGTFDGTSSDGGDVPDNDAAGLESRLVVPRGVHASTVQVQLNVAHSWRGDLDVTLTSPSGKTVPVWVRSDPGDSDDDVVGTFDLGGLGGDASGAWILRVVDLAPLDTGRLNHWRLGINRAL